MTDEQNETRVSPVDGDRGIVDDEALQADDPAGDPIWRLTSLVLPVGAGAGALLTLAQTLRSGLSTTTGYPGAAVLALLCAALLRDAHRRATAGRWVREEAYEYALPLGLLLVTLVLLVRGVDIMAGAPALLVLVPVAWEVVHAPRVERVMRLLPRALPVVGDEQATALRNDDEVEQIVRKVLDGLPPDIAAKMEGWTVEVRDEMLPRPRDEIVYGCCFGGANVIAIYRLPHLLYSGRGESLRRAVAYTVLHEVAHALGLDETGVRRLGWLSDNAVH